MKYIIPVGFIVVVGIAGVGSYMNKPVEVMNEKEVIEVVEATPEWQTDEEAIEAAKAVIDRKNTEAELNALEASFTSSTAIYEAEEADYKVKKEELEKKLNLFWKDKSNVINLIKDAFPEDPHTAVAVASCESGLKPNAYNPKNTNGSTDGGLWQINSTHDKSLKELGLDKYDPEDATKFARILYEESGWNPWVCWWHPDHLAMR